jgi:hypothetical protein
MSKRTAALILALPALLLIGWLVAEQWPNWTARPAPWARYPDLVALPGGCAAANALRIHDAERVDDETGVPLNAQQATVLSESLIRVYYPDTPHTLVSAPQLVRGHFGTAPTLAWMSLLIQAATTNSVQTGAVVFISTSTGEALDIIYVIDMAVQPNCGGYAPQTPGLRARLRPYLPLLLLAGYGVVVGGSALLWRRRRPPINKDRDL